LVNYWDKYTEMHDQQNVKKKAHEDIKSRIFNTHEDTKNIKRYVKCEENSIKIYGRSKTTEKYGIFQIFELHDNKWFKMYTKIKPRIANKRGIQLEEDAIYDL